MSVGLLRILVQNQVVTVEQAEHYYNESQAGKEVLPMLFSDGVISPKSLAALIARVFSYSILDLRHYPRHRVLMGVLTEEQMVEFHCVPVFRRGDKVFFAVSDPTQMPQIQKTVSAAGIAVELVIVEDDQLAGLLDWVGSRSTSLLQELGEGQEEEESHTLYIDNEEAEDGPVPRFIHKTLSDALRSGASDIHFEFYEHNARIRFRVDGQLREVVQPPIAVRGQLASRIKVMSRLDISEKRIPQDG